MKDSQIIIIGGGQSISEGISKNLWGKLKGKLTFGLNYSYRYFDSTIQLFVDDKFYNDEYNRLPDLPLIIGKDSPQLKIHPNTILLLAGNKYDPTLKKGIYKSTLAGIFALTIALYLEPKEIFLLGFDYGSITKKIIKKKYETHFYQKDITHRGTGKINYYTANGRAGRDFKPFERKGNIYNVSLKSAIPTFPKMSYDEFFNRLDHRKYDQNNLREIIKTKLKEVKSK